MTFKEALVERLLSDAVITGIVGEAISPVQADQTATLPIVLYQITGGAREMTLGGDLLPRRSSVAIYCFAATDAQASALAAAVNRTLVEENWTASGDLSVTIKIVVEDDMADGQEAPLHAEELAPYRVDLAFSITHQP